jgi:2-polyprenyl-3-methyl-5-hydroxy-6-metoxy-1,4-benzoquinol methylase
MKNYKSLSTKTIVYCELCSGVSGQFKIKNNFRYFKCKECSFVFLSPNPKENDIRSIYNKSEYVQSKLEPKHIKLVDKIFKLNTSFSKKQSLLDIGCQNGDFLNELSKRGDLSLYGIEASHEGAINAKKNKKLKVKEGFFDSKSYEKSKFDIINLGDVIEHLTEPKKMVNDIYEILKPGGLLIVSTPIYNCSYVFLNNFVNKILRSYPLAWLTPPFHIKYFSTYNLDSLILKDRYIKLEEFYSSSNFFYELTETQIFNNFREKNILQRLSIKNNIHLTLFCITYLLSKIISFFMQKKFSYTTIYQKKS